MFAAAASGSTIAGLFRIRGAVNQKHDESAEVRIVDERRRLAPIAVFDEAEFERDGESRKPRDICVDIAHGRAASVGLENNFVHNAR